MLITSIAKLRDEIKANAECRTIGLVPTMGYLHQGHASLIQRARAENDLVILSIFVNPTQFAPNEDYEQYPRDLDNDLALAYENGADYIFAPPVQEMYPGGYSACVNIEGPITSVLCGANRPNHFRGVTTVVSKLFNIAKPSRAYFGQKDAQQLSVIQKLVRDMNFDVTIVPCPIVRDADGLALSSRNVYLNEMEREQATILYQSLKEVEAIFSSGKRNSADLKKFIIEKICSMSLANIDYVEIVDFETLERVETIEKASLVALAVKFGQVRLIDNLILGV